MNTVFIQANNKQLFGARLAAFALTMTAKDARAFHIEILNVDSLSPFAHVHGKTFKRWGQLIDASEADLQSFTLSRFMPPELMGFQGRAIVIDPDIFALSDIGELFSLDMQGRAIAACAKKGAWDSSVMLLDCAQLSHWRIKDLLHDLYSHERDYDEIMMLAREGSVLELSRDWNSLDALPPSARMLHTTNRITQPWKTGLPVDFKRRPLPKIFGIIPREPLLRVLGKYPMTYQRHPDPDIETYFFKLVARALQANTISRTEIQHEIERGHVRQDLWECISRYI